MARKATTPPADDFGFTDSGSSSTASTIEQPAPPSALDAAMDPVSILARHLNVPPEQIGDLGKLQ